MSFLKWLVVGVVMILTLSGCASKNSGQMALLYADLKQMYGVVHTDLHRACAGPSAKLDQVTCDRLKAANELLGRADAVMREQIGKSGEIDLEKVASFVSILVQAGLASQTGGASTLLPLLLR